MPERAAFDRGAMAQAFTILLVEDDELVRTPVAEALSAAGFRVLTAESAIQAMRILAQEHVDVLFTDVVMPGQNGIELAKEAKLLRPQLHVIFATGYLSRAEEAKLAGKLLFKPLRAHQIEAAIREFMAAT